jgi:integrase
MNRPSQKVLIFKVQDRSARKNASRPFVARREVDGHERSTAFETYSEADAYRSRLLVARHDGERFDPRTGEPASWAPQGRDLAAHLWARKWVAEHWAEWQPRTRTNELDGLVRFLPLLAAPRAPTPPHGLRTYLRDTLPPDVDLDPTHECERWLARWMLSLGELDRQNLAEANRVLAIGDRHQQLGRETARRYRRTAKACVHRAYELEYIPVDPWPPTPRGRSRRKVNRVDVAIDVKRLHAPATIVRVLDAMVNPQPASEMYQAMQATVYYAGMRPSEVKMLRPAVLHLPDADWGWIDVEIADDGEANPADPKTGRRRVPIPPRLVCLLRDWIVSHDIGPQQFLFRTREGNPPSESNWSRALRRAHRQAKVHHIAVYDYRHAAATHWLLWGMVLAEVARRLGDNVETVVAYYINAMEGDEASGNAAVETGLETTRDAIRSPAVTSDHPGPKRPAN